MPVISTLYTRLVQLAVAGLLALGAVALVGISPAWAHNSLVKAVPAEGAVMQETPTEVRLRFLNQVSDRAELKVTGADGESAIGEVGIAGKEIFAPFTATGAGDYTVSYTVLSGDGHEITEEYAFEVKPSTVSPSPALESTATDEPTPSRSLLGEDALRPVAADGGRPWWLYIGGAVVAGLVVGAIIAAVQQRRKVTGK